MFATPVVGPTGADIPTSGDVHLHCDPPSLCSQRPILYADCEGLDGGEREPLANKFRSKEKASKPGGGKVIQTNMPTSERELTWQPLQPKGQGLTQCLRCTHVSCVLSLILQFSF